MNLLVNRLLSFEQQDAPFQPVIDYAGTASYGAQGHTAGVGSSLPQWRATLNTRFSVGAASLDLRTRYIGAMGNRAAAQYPGEAFTSPDAITYWDAGAGYQLTSKLLVRAGINNVLDQSPPVYAPNIHAGTDPSLYDVVGRILLAQIRISI